MTSHQSSAVCGRAVSRWRIIRITCCRIANGLLECYNDVFIRLCQKQNNFSTFNRQINGWWTGLIRLFLIKPAALEISDKPLRKLSQPSEQRSFRTPRSYQKALLAFMSASQGCDESISCSWVIVRFITSQSFPTNWLTATRFTNASQLFESRNWALWSRASPSVVSCRVRTADWAIRSRGLWPYLSVISSWLRRFLKVRKEHFYLDQ